MVKRVLWLLAVLGLFMVPPAGAEYPPGDRDYKAAHLHELVPYGPGTNEAARPVWQRLIRICAAQQDGDIADAIFDVAQRTDGITSTQYGLDLYDLFQAAPGFFVKAAGRYYGGDFVTVLAVWINEAGEVSVSQLAEALAPFSGDSQVERFLSTARRMERALTDHP